MRLEAIVFDYGLTLVSFSYPAAALLEVMDEIRPWLGPRPPSAAWLLENVLVPLEDDLKEFSEAAKRVQQSLEEIDYLDLYDRAWRRAGLTLARDVQYKILDLEQQCWDRSVEVAPGAFETLAALRSRGILTGIASNAPFPTEMMRRQLAHTGLDSQMDGIVFSSEIGWRKPATQLYAAILDQLGVQAGAALYVGDRVVEDHDGPLRAGMRAVICTQLTRSGPPPGIPTISHLTELAEML